MCARLRRVAGALIAVVVLLVMFSSSAASETDSGSSDSAGGLPGVTISATTDGVVEGLCGPYKAASFTLHRDRSDGTLTVNYSFSVVNYDAVLPPTPGQVTFPAGQAFVTVPLEFSRNVSGFIVSVESGDGYERADPQGSTFIQVQGDPFCPYPTYLAQLDTNLRQTIHVGEQPTAFVLVDPTMTLAPRLPVVHPVPGLSLDDQGHWVGVATKPGVYSLQLYCSNCSQDNGDFVFQLTVLDRALPRTGSATTPLTVTGIALVLGGYALIRFGDRRSRTPGRQHT